MSTSTHVHAHPGGRIADDTSLAELTVRGIILGAIITVIFTASNVYLGLKVGLTFSSSIPAAVISLAVLRMFLRVGTRHGDAQDAALGRTQSKTVGNAETGITETVVGSEFGTTTQWLGLIVFAAVAWMFARRVLAARAAI